MKEEGPRMPNDDEKAPEDAIAALVLRRGKLTAEESEQFEALFTEMVNTHGKEVLAQIQRRIRDAVEAEDIAQEMFLTLAFKLLDLGFIENIGGMLHRLTQGKLLNHAVRTRRNIVSLGMPSSGSAPPAPTVDVETALDDRALTQQFFEALSTEHEDVVDAVLVRELRYVEAARELSIDDATLASRLQAAKKHWRKMSRALPSSQKRRP
jgi:DNA-directed RNA polymerase specialized sigma24 family protein